MLNPTPFVPKEIRRRDQGLKPSVARLINMIDPTDDSFPNIVGVLSEMSEAGVEIDEQAVSIALKMAKNRPVEQRRKPRAMPGLPMWTDAGDEYSIVYYVRRGDLIKIGTTTRPVKRFEALLPDEILAVEPGDRSVELTRHRQFWHLRKGHGEYFTQADDLDQHIQCIRKTHGDPDPTWRTTANVALSNKARLLPTHLPAPTSPATASAAEAVALLGIGMATVYGWVRRNKISRVGLNDRGQAVYYVEHLQRLAESYWKRTRKGPRVKGAPEGGASVGQTA